MWPGEHAQGSNPLEAARALVSKIFPGITKDDSAWKGCSNWSAGAFGYNNAQVVKWLKYAEQNRTDSKIQVSSRGVGVRARLGLG